MKQIGLCAAIAVLLTLPSVAIADDVTLRVWDTFAEEDAQMDAFIDAFEEAHPGITIDRNVQSADDIRLVIQTALNSGTGPDVFYYDTGPGFAGALAKAGLLLPLDDAYSDGAFDAVYDWTKERTTFDGITYGVGNEIEFLGVYYNQDLFEELGLEVPTTHEEFVAVSEALKEAGTIPIAFGNSQGWPAFHIFSLYANNMIDQADLEAMIAGEVSWDDPAVASAIQPFFVDLHEADLLTPSVNAVNYDDTLNLFRSGMAGMKVTGTWLIGRLTDTDFSTGWFFLPPPGGGDPLPPAGLGSGYFVSAQTEHPEEAIEFLNFMFDPASAKYWVEDMARIPPYPVDTEGLQIAPLLRFALEALATVPMGYNIDVLMPQEFNSAMLDGFQAVLGGDRTPEEQAAALQAAVE